MFTIPIVKKRLREEGNGSASQRKFCMKELRVWSSHEMDPVLAN
jgi:hypothetical protein